MEKESMRQFNYYGQTRLENLDEHDIVGLEREIDYLIRNSLGQGHSRGATAAHSNMIDINGNRVISTADYNLPKKKSKTAGHANPRIAKKKALKHRKQQVLQTGGDELQMNDQN